MRSTKAKDIDEYISLFPAEVQKNLSDIRKAIAEAAPKATEAIKYDLPTFVQNGNLVHFGAFKNHIGLYPAPQSLAEFKESLAAYEGTKGSVHFPHDKPMPLALIKQIVKFRIKQLSEKSMAKKKVKSK